MISKALEVGGTKIHRYLDFEASDSSTKLATRKGLGSQEKAVATDHECFHNCKRKERM